MRALITNDDGIGSAGLGVLARVARAAGMDTTVVAPAHEFSGASAALIGATEVTNRFAVEEVRAPGVPDDVPCLAVAAAPALITFLAAYDGFGPRPDVVLSGVNRGPNTGFAVLHSGTVGAALSAATHGIRALAVSTWASDPEHWDTAEAVAAHVLPWVLEHEPGAVLNVNVPDVPPERLRGVRTAPLAAFGAVQATIERGDTDLTVTYQGIDATEDPESDAGLVTAGWATLTLLRSPWAVTDVDLPEHLDGVPRG